MPAEVTAYVSVGSNLGDRWGFLRHARERLGVEPGIARLRISPVYQSTAVGPGVQPEYLNAVLELRTSLPPHALFAALQSIERDAGRERIERWGPRTLDLDLLTHGEASQDDAHLTLPHPRLATRNFVVYPLYDLAPALVLPDGTSVAELRERLSPEGLSLAGSGPGGVPDHA